MTTFDTGIQADPLELSKGWERVIQFDDDSFGYYCFLLPLLDGLAKKTRQYVERERDAVYEGATLEDLAATIANAKQLLEQKPDTWEEHVFPRVFPYHEIIYTTVSKQRMEKIIETIEAAVEKARSNGLYITFWD